MSGDGHRYTFAAPDITFDADGLRIESCPFCANWTGPYRDLADHVRNECGK